MRIISWKWTNVKLQWSQWIQKEISKYELKLPTSHVSPTYPIAFTQLQINRPGSKGFTIQIPPLLHGGWQGLITTKQLDRIR